MRKILKVSALCCIGVLSALRAERVDFTGSKSGELSDTGNWSAASWGNNATQCISSATAEASVLRQGLTLTSSLAPAKTFHVTGLGDNLAIDLGDEGHFQTKELFLSGNGRKTLTLSGRVNNLANVLLNSNCRLALTNGVFHIATGNFRSYNWYDTLLVCKNAELVVDKVDADTLSGSYSRYAGIRIDGGTLTIKGYRDPSWSRVVHGTIGDNFLEIVNGGLYYEDAGPEFYLRGPRTRFLIDAGGAYIATNSIGASRNMKVGITNGTFAVSNGTLLVSQLYAGEYKGPYYQNLGLYNDTVYEMSHSRFTFHNARAAFKFWKSQTYKGAFLLGGEKVHDNEVLLDGPQNDFYTSYLLLGGVSNTFTVADGVFMAERVYFLPGSDNTLVFTGGKSVVSNLFPATEGVVPTNLHVRIAAAGDVTFVNGFSLHGTNAAMSVSGGSLYVPTPKTMVCADDHARLDITGGIVTGIVEFAANHGRMVVGPGARAVATFGSSPKYAPLVFAPGKTDNALVLSNGTFTSHMVFLGGLVTTEEMPKSEAYPITNVPDCRIEFHGENPCLEVTSNKRYTTDGGPWYAFAIGNSHNPAPLENPLTLKFFLPENGYAQAPVRVEVATAVLGGNAHLDFDVTGFKWPSRTVRIPLIYNASAFKGYNRYTYIDVAGLNATNASRLPSRDGHTAYLACSADGKTLELVVPGNGGTVVLMR